MVGDNVDNRREILSKQSRRYFSESNVLFIINLRNIIDTKLLTKHVAITAKKGGEPRNWEDPERRNKIDHISTTATATMALVAIIKDV